MEDMPSESERMFHLILENSPLGLVSFDGKGVITACNNRCVEVVGAQRKELLGLCLLDLPDEKLVLEVKAALNGSHGLYEGDSHWVSSEKATPVRILFAPMAHIEGNGGGLGIVEDITTRRRLEADLARAHEIIDQTSASFSVLAENLPIPISYFDVDSLRLQYVNKAFQDAVGLSKEKIIGTHLRDQGGEENFHFVLTSVEKARAGNSVSYENYFNTATGKRWVQVTYIPVRDRQGKIVSVLVFNIDMNEHKQAEERIKALLEEKELILKEVHHRIKNNMNTINSILALQAGTLCDPAAIAALEDAQSRIQSMVLLYDKLYRSTSFTDISSIDYIYPLVDDIVANFPNSPSVHIEKTIEEFALSVTKIQPLGILMNELLTNIMKYAFVGRTTGLIRVSASLKSGIVSISIQDNGIGMPESIDFENSPGFGLLLVDTLTKQLNGTIRIERGNGTRITLEFGE
jgi:PAS domain S-box-containing protein